MPTLMSMDLKKTKMKSNQQIINEWSGGLTGITTDEAIPAMKEAQVEVIKEMILRYNKNNLEALFHGVKYKNVSDIALELIKEIEG